MKPVVLISQSPGPALALDKRTYLPFIVTFACPFCEAVNRRDLRVRDYLSHPLVNEPFEYTLWCEECDRDDTSVQLRLNVSLEVVDG